MHNIKRNIFAKALAIFLSVLVLITTAASVLCVIFCSAMGGYTGEYAYNQDELMEGLLYGYAYEIADAYRNGNDLQERYAGNNFYYTITATGKEPSGGEPFVRSVAYYGTGYTITVYEKAEKDGDDLLSLAAYWTDIAYEMRYAAIILSFVGLSLFIFILLFLFSAAGHHRGEEKANLNYVDRIPFDLYTALCTAIAVGINALGNAIIENLYYGRHYYNISEEFLRIVMLCLSIALLSIINYLILLGFSLSFATRVKVGGLIRRTLIFRLLAFLYKMIAKAGKGVWSMLRSIPLIPKTVLILLGITLLEFILLVANLWEGDNLLILWLVEKAVLLPLILWIAMQLRKLKKGGEAIAAGRLQEKIDTRYMPADFGKFGQTLNHIGDGLEHAVDEKMKSERMKTELITNVSHDIKTPLTSIVNYVDLIEKEEPKSESMREYISVLKRQSARLKKLIEDLVEASKASSGTLTVEMARCEVGVLLEQTLGEYAEKLGESRLTPVVTTPEDPVFILADGRRLWRVFDNLLNNICKYAQPDTRVYISLERLGKRAVITFRNISKEALNISSDELMERFVRGDSSRNTEGSGLGLSIARSLTELQNGRLALAIDGDLFKATVSFETIE